jgi:hypothetical protein
VHTGTTTWSKPYGSLHALLADSSLRQLECRSRSFHDAGAVACCMTCDKMAITSIRHKGLRRRWEHDDPRGVPAEAAAKLRRMLAGCTDPARRRSWPRLLCRDGGYIG